jgi:hypothetical protein
VTYPNLVIAGAPKCGTSSLFNWLVDHPDVCGSSVKETFFLMDRDNPLRRKACNFHDHGLEAYASFFPDCSSGDRIVVEATTHYLYQQTALDVLASLATRPRILFVLRKPSERVLSSFGFSRNNLGRVRGDLSFSDYVRLVESGDDPRTFERRLGAGPSAYVLARDLRYSRYVDYLAQWRDRVGEDRMRILLFEEMSADPRREVQTICDWLGIDPSFYASYDFTARNRTVAVRSPRLQRLAIAVARRMRDSKVKALAKRLFVALQSGSGKPARSGQDEAALDRLDAQFKPWNDRLSQQFGLDLDPWQ